MTSCSNNNNPPLITEVTFCIDSTSKLSSSSPPRIKRRISIRNANSYIDSINDDDDNDIDETSISSSCSQSTFASNDNELIDNSNNDVWLINSDDDFDIDESLSTSSSSSTYDFSDLDELKDNIGHNADDDYEDDPTDDCQNEVELDNDIIPNICCSYENDIQQNTLINKSTTSSNNHNQRNGNIGRRSVSFDSCTYIREYNLATTTVGSTTTNDDIFLVDNNNKNNINNKYLLQLSWEHTPIIIGSLHKREQQKLCKKYKPLRRLNIRQRRNRIELLHDTIAIRESNGINQNYDDKDDSINHHNNMEYYGNCSNVDVAKNHHVEEITETKTSDNGTTIMKKLLIEDVSWNDINNNKNNNNNNNATNNLYNAKKPIKTTSSSCLEPLTQKEYPRVGATAA